MRNTNKKGFTIVELVVVVAVIAILAAVLIPTFSGIIKKANLSADQKAVRDMNTVLAATTEDIGDIALAKIQLAKNGIDAENYKPLSKDHDFIWVEGLNRIVLVDGEDKVVFPADLASSAEGKPWWSLSGEGASEAAESIKSSIATGTATLTGVTDMKGASLNLVPTGNVTIGGATPTATATIKNVVSDEGSKNAAATGAFAKVDYAVGMIREVPAGKTVKVQNLVIDGAVIGDTTNPDSAYAGIIAGSVKGHLIIENVTIKNSTVFGSYRVGALVGYVQSGGKLTLNNVTIENTTVKGATFTAALVGQAKGSIEYQTPVNKTNVEVTTSDFNPTDSNTTLVFEGNNYVLSYNEDDGYYYASALTTNDYWGNYTYATDPINPSDNYPIWACNTYTNE